MTATPIEEYFPGMYLGERYMIQRRIGEGGYGQVYLAYDCVTQQRVCVKVSTRSLRREGDLLALALHPQVPKVLELHYEEPYWYLVMEFIEGKTLLRYLRDQQETGQRMAVDEVLQVGYQVASILASLHDRPRYPLIVCDIKPENLIRRPDGQIVLIDFGIARLGPVTAQKGVITGTRGYVPIEYMTQGYISTPTDVYALGATLHHLLTGEPPCTCRDPHVPCGSKCFLPRILRGSVGDVVTWMLDPVYQERPSASDLKQVFGLLLRQHALSGSIRKCLQPILARLNVF